MKNRNVLTVAALATVMLFSCEKENLMETQDGGVTSPISKSYETPEDLAKQLMAKGRMESSNWTDLEYKEKIQEAEALIAEHFDPKTNTLSSGGNTPLTDVCYVYEGIFNFNFGDIETPNDFLEHVEQDYTVDINVDAEGNYYLTNQEVVDLYAELQSTATTEVDPSNSEFLLFCDLTLQSVNPSSSTAIVRASMSIALQKPLALAPTQAYLGANLAGPCANSTPNSTDAATYIDAYWQKKIHDRVNYLKNQNGHANYYTYYQDAWGSMTPNLEPSPGYWNTNVAPYFWKSETNDCLGNTNAEWQSLYSNSDILANEALLQVYRDFPAPHRPNEIIEVFYESIDFGPIGTTQGMPYFPNMRYGHRGTFHVGHFVTF